MPSPGTEVERVELVPAAALFRSLATRAADVVLLAAAAAGKASSPGAATTAAGPAVGDRSTTALRCRYLAVMLIVVFPLNDLASPGQLEYFDLRELQDTIVNRALRHAADTRRAVQPARRLA
jgi:hypothetical protein